MLGDYEPSAEHYTEVEDRICASGKRNATRPFETASRLFSGTRTGASLSVGAEFRIVESESATRGMNRRDAYSTSERYLADSLNAVLSAVIGSPFGMNSWVTYPVWPVSRIVLKIAG